MEREEAEREKKPVCKHWNIIQKINNEKHPHARCKYCPKEFKRAIPERMQKHLDKKCPHAPSNAKSQTGNNLGNCMDEKEQNSFNLLDKTLSLEMLFSNPFIVQWYR